MTLGDTLKLGYLECAGWNSEPPSLHAHTPIKHKLDYDDLVPEANLVLGGSLKLSGTAKSANSDGQESFVEALDWTHQPHREVQKSGNVCYRVSNKSAPSLKDNKQHLVRTTRLEPRPASRSGSRPGSRSGSRPPMPEKAEKIVVTEADLRRCGRSLTLLRQCQVLPNHSDRAEKSEFELSFKSGFEKRCRSQDHELRNPWKELGNPEHTRDHSEGDLILNQVWVDPSKSPSPPQKILIIEEEDAPMSPCLSSRSRPRSGHPTRAASADAASMMRDTEATRRRKGSWCPSRSSRGSSRERHGEPTSARTPPPTGASEGTSEGRRRRAHHASGLPRPAIDFDITAKPGSTKKVKEYESRIQLIEDEEEEEVLEVGSIEVRNATRMQRRFEHRLEEEANSKPRAVWVKLDPSTGEVSHYETNAAKRLESAHHHNRTNVPLSGLGGDLEEAIVHLGGRGTGDYPYQKSWHGEQMDVRRLEVPPYAEYVSVHVLCENGGWRISDVAVPGRTEERCLVVTAIETVKRGDSPPLPPVNPDRRLFFTGAGCAPQWD